MNQTVAPMDPVTDTGTNRFGRRLRNQHAAALRKIAQGKASMSGASTGTLPLPSVLQIHRP